MSVTLKSWGLFLVLVFSIFPQVSFADLCQYWNHPEEIGFLNPEILNEASGLEFSSQFQDRAYHINDSGDGPHLYMTRIDGINTQIIRIAQFDPQDTEDLTLGPCYENHTCVIIGDIGDNRKNRPELTLVVLEEKERYADPEIPLEVLRVKYPDGPRDAEALALHPNGDLFILTKEYDLDRPEPFAARLYRLRKQEWEHSDGQLLEMTFVGEIDFSLLEGTASTGGRLVTSMDISSDGERVLILTYENAFELKLNLSQENPLEGFEFQLGQTYQLISLTRLPQQEAISYLPNQRDFVYSTEYHRLPPPMMKLRCTDPEKH